MKMKRTQIYIEPNTVKQLKHYAVEMDISMAEIIRLIIRSHLGLVTLRDKPFIESLDKKIKTMNELRI